MQPVRPLSASQIDLYKSCNRKWAWRHVAKIEVPTHPSAAKGTRVHSQLERYLKGEPFDCTTADMRAAMEIALPGIENLPPPKTPGMQVEHAFSFTAPSGAVFRGFMDVVVADSASVPGLTGGAPAVIDHKSAKDWRYIKTPEILSTDTQAMLYAHVAMQEFSAESVDLVWNYIRTSGSPATKRVHLRVHQPHVNEQFQSISQTGEEISVTYSASPNPLDLEPNTDACSAYGGCPYRSHCTDLRPGPFGHTPKKDKTMTTVVQTGFELFAKLATPVTPAAPAPVAMMLPPPPVKVATDEAVAKALTRVTNDHKELLQELALTDGGKITEYGASLAAINPPEFQPPPPPPSFDATPAAAAEKPKRTRRTKAQIEADAKAAAPRAAQVDMLPGVVEGSAAAEELDTCETIPAPAAPAASLTCDPRDADLFGFFLYVNCAPDYEYTDCAEIFAKAKELVNKELDVSDYRFAPYGKGQGAFSVAVNSLVDSAAYDALVLDTSTPEGALVLNDLVARASGVVRGFR